MDLEQLDIFSFIESTENKAEEILIEEKEELDLSIGGYSLEPISLIELSENGDKNKDLSDDDVINLSQMALENLEELLSISGIDGAFIPTDTSVQGDYGYAYPVLVLPQNLESFYQSSNNISGKEGEVFERYDIETTFGEHYKPTYLVEEFEEFPVINFYESKEKMMNTVSIFTNKLFKDFYVKLEGTNVNVKFPEEMFERVDKLFDLFQKPRDFFDKLKPTEYPLYFLIRPYMEMTRIDSGYYDIRNNTVEWLRSLLPTDLFSIEEDEGFYLLTYDIDNFTNRIRSAFNWRARVENFSDVYASMKFLYNTFIPLFMLYDASERLLESVEQRSRESLRGKIIEVSRARETFVESLNSRLVPIESLNHKAAVKEAEKLGMTHFFIPFSNKSFAFEKGTPIMVAEGEEWEILPPDPYLLENSDFDYGGIKTYESYYEEHSYLATRSAPHLLGRGLSNATLNEKEFTDIFSYLFKDYENFNAFKNTEAIIEKYPLVRKRLTDLSSVKLDELESKSEVETFDKLFGEPELDDFEVLHEAKEQLRITDTDRYLEKGDVLNVDNTLFVFDGFYLNAEKKAVGMFSSLINGEAESFISDIAELDVVLATEEELNEKEKDFFEKDFLPHVKSLNSGIGLNTSIFSDRTNRKIYLFHKEKLIDVHDSSWSISSRTLRRYIYKLIQDGTLKGINLPFILPTGYLSTSRWTLGESTDKLNININRNSYIYLNETEMEVMLEMEE